MRAASAALIALWADVVWNQRTDAGLSILDEAVVWEGAIGGANANGREEVLALLRQWDRPPRLTHLEAAERDDQVVVSSEGPDLLARRVSDGRPNNPADGADDVSGTAGRSPARWAGS